jgi:Holliday junction resolvase-like predicted endonuclease
LERNYQTQYGEIDLIAREARELVAQAAAAAEKEKKALELASQVEIEQLHQRTAPKLTEAKKICR